MLVSTSSDMQLATERSPSLSTSISCSLSSSASFVSFSIVTTSSTGLSSFNRAFFFAEPRSSVASPLIFSLGRFNCSSPNTGEDATSMDRASGSLLGGVATSTDSDGLSDLYGAKSTRGVLEVEGFLTAGDEGLAAACDEGRVGGLETGLELGWEFRLVGDAKDTLPLGV